MEMLKFQEVGRDFLLNTDEAILAMDMGLGKSLTAIRAAEVIMASGPGIVTVVVCPPALVANWQAEVKKWSPEASTFTVTKPSQKTYPTNLSKQQWIIAPYTRIPQLISILDSSKEKLVWVLIADEAHCLKNYGALRTKYFFGYTEKRYTPWVPGLTKLSLATYFLTGTPMPNYPSDLYNMCRHCDYDNFPSYSAFEEKYCITRSLPVWDRRGKKHIVTNVVGGKNLDELKQKMAPFTYRVTKPEVLSELPDKIYSQVTIPVISKVSKLSSQLEKEIIEAVENSENPPHLATVRRELALAKVPGAVDYIATLLDEEKPDAVKKLLVFGIHTEALTSLHEKLLAAKIQSKLCIGSTSMSDRQAAVEEFQSPDSSLRVLVCNLQAMGVGHTLTAANTVMFLEQSYTPADNLQAEDRVHRIGQTEQCNIIVLFAEGSCDHLVYNILERKKDCSKQLFGKV